MSEVFDPGMLKKLLCCQALVGLLLKTTGYEVLTKYPTFVVLVEHIHIESLVEDLLANLICRGAHKGLLASSQKTVRDDAKCPNVYTSVVVLRLNKLWSHVELCTKYLRKLLIRL